MIHIKFKYLLILLVGTLLLPVFLNAKGDKKDNKNIRKTNDATQIGNTRIDINNLNSLQSNFGFSDYNLNSNLGGCEYPKGSGKTAMFESGFLWGGYAVDNGVKDPQVRVGGSAYYSGLQPGPILANGQPDPNPSASKWRIYRVRPDVYPGGPAVDLSQDAVWEGIDASTLKTQYELDWNEWPAAGTANDLGAPFKDINGDGKYEPGIDIPGVPGADQTVFYVANDQSSQLTTTLYGATPLGLEVHGTYWAYAQQGALGNMYFKKYQLFNKGYQKYTIDSMFVSWWADVDLGDGNDDLMGCDTTLSLSYTYNGYNTDAVYAPLPPPADGFDFFEGPIVNGDPTDVAIFNGQLVSGKKNLPMTSAYFFVRTVAEYTDPPQGTIDGSTQFYRLFNGLLGHSGQPLIDNKGNVTKFAFYGDPVTRTGWIDGISIPPADRRQGMASGPFNMAPGDTQEVVVAEIVAGAIPGVDRLSAINLMKFYDRTAQEAYNNFFILPTAPPAPKVNVAQLSNKIVLDWGEDQAAVTATENYNNKGYTFEGYNIYQIDPTGRNNPVRLATYDLNDGILKVYDDYFDAAQGTVLSHVSAFGSDNGIQRSMFITTDALNANNPLVNGIQYSFAVTAYGYSETAVPHALENPIKPFVVTPQSPNPGVRYAYTAGDTIIAAHSSGKSQGTAFALVVDPTRLTGDQYKVTFDTTGGNTTWVLTDVTKNKVVLSKQTNLSGDDNYTIVDGMMLKVTGPPTPGMNSGGQKTGWDIPNGTRRFTWAGNSLAANWGLEGFNGTIGWASPDWFFNGDPQTVPAGSLCNTLITLAQVTDTTLFDPAFPSTADINLSFGYRYLRRASQAAAEPRFAPHIIHTSGGTYPFQDFAQTVPMSAWNVDDPAHPARLVVGYLENNVAGGLVDGKYWPPDYTQRDQATTREFLWIFQAPYSTTPDAAFQIDALDATTPIPVMWFVMWERRGAVPFSPGGTGEDQFLIYANHINTINDQFTFTATAPTTNQTLAKKDVNSINVFPNPYYGVNSQETNKYSRFVTFNHLPANATIRVFNLAGTMVRTINHSNGSQFDYWDLANESGLPVASGLYIVYIDMPDLGATKILKLAIIQEQQFLERF